MKVINYKFILMFFLTTCFTFCTTIKPTGDINYVPNEETAIKIAETILIPIYGNEVLTKRPFTAKLINGNIWHIEGSIGLDELGGIPIIEIQKKDCKILRVTHTK
ncbi:NTF2 fold immunity protein [Flavobacterium anhuiense]|uniref:NTF2 fold immunity protein n=1 Tax=Flavobacterium anhuiense TaxID=459526 RepID=A0ABY0LXY9_9FLAO|nr:NTF2 fold immunity protein [Flavobacterium anhuiense]SCY77870.1 NTF2 fold immunity protein [Flavobacterium anhuiense]